MKKRHGRRAGVFFLCGGRDAGRAEFSFFVRAGAVHPEKAAG